MDSDLVDCLILHEAQQSLLECCEQLYLVGVVLSVQQALFLFAIAFACVQFHTQAAIVFALDHVGAHDESVNFYLHFLKLHIQV
ncbi:hypothetical protein D3C80_1674960 [compost metagenome]